MATTKQSSKKPAPRSKKAPAKKPSKVTRRAASNKVDYYPNRESLAIAVLAVVILFTLALITAL